VDQDRGLLAPPRRDGRVGIYTDAQVLDHLQQDKAGTSA